MKRRHQKTLEQIYKRPTSGNIPWMDIESLFKALGAVDLVGEQEVREDRVQRQLAARQNEPGDRL